MAIRLSDLAGGSGGAYTSLGAPIGGADDWFASQGAPSGAAGLRAPRQSAEDTRLLQDPAFRAQYGTWVQSQGPGAADWATPTGYQQWLQQQGAPTPTTPGSPAGPAGPPRDYASAQAAFHQLFPGETLTPQMLKEKEAELQALGFTLRPNAQGVVGKIQWGNEPIVDVIQGAGSGLNRKQWLAGAPAGSGVGAGLETSPGYQFRLGEGLKALERSAAARGTLLTGGTLKGLARYGQDYASNEYANRVQQLMGLSQMGMGAAGGAGSAASAYGREGGDLYTQMGNAQAGGTVGAANAWQQPITGATNLAQMYLLSRMMNPSGGGGGVAPTGSTAAPMSGTRGTPLLAGNPYMPRFGGWG
jgi:hypothetical protein